MKVIVRCARNRVTKADMEREIEKLFQENKDLRVSEGHLRDDLACAQARIEKLTAELAASSQGMHTMVKFWEEAVNEKIKAEERAEEYHIALMESDCRVDECEKRIEYLEDELKQTEAIANQVIEERDELRKEHEKDLGTMRKLDAKIDKLNAELVKHESKHYQQEAEEWKMTADKLDERVQDLNAQLRDVQADYNELSDDYSDVQRINRDYAQEIDRLRKVVVDLQTHRFTVSEIQNMICKYLEGFEPSTGSLNF